MHQTIDLSQTSGANNSMLTDQSDSTPVSRIDLRHTSQATSSQASPKCRGHDFKSGFKPSTQHSRESIKEEVGPEEGEEPKLKKEEVANEEEGKEEEAVRETTPRMREKGKDEEPEEKEQSPEGRSPKKNFVKMNIEKMKQTKKSVLERKLASGKRSVLR